MPYLAVLLCRRSRCRRCARLAFVDAHITASVPNAKKLRARSWSGERGWRTPCSTSADSAAFASADRIALRGDATVGVSETDGSRLGWKGLIEIGKVSGDAALLTERWDSDRKDAGREACSTARRPGRGRCSRRMPTVTCRPGRDPSIGWNGTDHAGGRRRVQIEPGGTGRRRARPTSLAGAAQAMVPDASRMRAAPGRCRRCPDHRELLGRNLELEAVRLAAPHLAVDAKKLVVDGTADASRRLQAPTRPCAGRAGRPSTAGRFRAAAGEPVRGRCWAPRPFRPTERWRRWPGVDVVVDMVRARWQRHQGERRGLVDRAAALRHGDAAQPKAAAILT
ncbi:MAG: hypothetical protein U0575_14040 [Phycisphaerales bacterium]